MTESDDELMDRLGRLDPVLVDPSPVAGSPRFTALKEHVMTTTTPTAPRRSASEPTGQPRPRLKGPRVLVGAAAAISALAIGLVLGWPSGTPGAAAQVLAAAQNSGHVTDFRVTIRTDNVNVIPGGVAEVEVDGDNVHLTAGGQEIYIVDGTEWLLDGGEVVSTGPAETALPPYGESSEALITAALESDDVSVAGTEVLNGVVTTHYVIRIDERARAALSALPTETLGWFVEDVGEEAEVLPDGSEVVQNRSGFLDLADSLDIWVADDLVHQIAVDSGSSQFTHTFYDFDDVITVSPPE